MIESPSPRPLDTRPGKLPASDGGPPAAKGGVIPEARFTDAQIADLQKILREFSGAKLGAPDAANDGAPELAAPSTDSTEDEFVTKLAHLMNKTAETGLQSGMLNLNIAQRKVTEQTTLRINKMKEAYRKEASAESRKKTHGILGWLKRIAMPVAMGIGLAVAIAATVATAGAASPLAMLMMAAVITSSGMGLANSISSEAGGPPIEIASYLAKGMAAAASLISEEVFHHHLDPADAKNIGLVASGIYGAPLALVDPQFGAQLTVGIAGLAGTKDENKLAIINMALTSVTTIAIGIAGMAVGGGAGAKASVENAGRLKELCIKAVQNKALMTSAGVTQGVASGTGGTAEVGQGVIGIENAYDLRDAALAHADGKRAQAIAIRMQAALEGMQNELSKIYENLSAGMGTLADIIKDNSRIRTQLIESRMGPTA